MVLVYVALDWLMIQILPLPYSPISLMTKSFFLFYFILIFKIIYIIKKNRELVRTNAVMGLGIAYAGSAREDLLDLLIPIVVDTTISVELSAMAALSLGLIFVGKCTEEVTNAILETLTERPENILDISIARFFSLGMGLLFLG